VSEKNRGGAVTTQAIERRWGYPSAGFGRVFGLPRSGNHAIISWLLRNAAPDGYVFANNCAAQKDVFESAYQLEIDGKIFWSKEKKERGVAPLLARRAPHPFTLVSYEGAMPFLPPKGGLFTPDIDPDAYAFDVVILRSFLNWLASLVTLYEKEGPKRGREPLEVAQWILTTVIRYKQVMRSVNEGLPARFTLIRYDDWAASEEERARLLAAMDLPVLDNGLGDTARYGGGSSFTGTASAAPETPPPRWLALRDHPSFRAHAGFCAADPAFMADLRHLYPEDAERLDALAAG